MIEHSKNPGSKPDPHGKHSLKRRRWSTELPAQKPVHRQGERRREELRDRGVRKEENII